MYSSKMAHGTLNVPSQNRKLTIVGDIQYCSRHTMQFAKEILYPAHGAGRIQCIYFCNRLVSSCSAATLRKCVDSYWPASSARVKFSHCYKYRYMFALEIIVRAYVFGLIIFIHTDV